MSPQSLSPSLQGQSDVNKRHRLSPVRIGDKPHFEIQRISANIRMTRSGTGAWVPCCYLGNMAPLAGVDDVATVATDPTAAKASGK